MEQTDNDQKGPKDALAKRGSLLQVESGEYSDYQVHGFFVVLRDFIPRAALESFIAKEGPPSEWRDFDDCAFLAHLIASGALLEIEPSVLHISDYGKKGEFRFCPMRRPDGD